MKRFNIPTMNISGSSAPHATNNSANAPAASNSSFLMSSSATAMSIGSSLRKINILPTNKPLFSSGMDESQSKSAEKKESQRNRDINFVLKILEDVRLQRPLSHTGLVIAYSTALQAPITYKGIKFTWYRQGNEISNQFNVVDESFRSWYSPTVDDIGCKICVQCEDNYNQGFSRYVECEPLCADPLLCSLTETALKNSFYEALDVNVSLGLEEKELVVNDDSSEVGSEFSPVSTLYDQTSNLSADTSAFLQFAGRSVVIVDSKGLFISIPVSVSESSAKGQPAKSTKLRTSSRGLRIAPSESIRVHCSQPASIIIEIPIRTSQTTPSNASSKPADFDSEAPHDTDPSMESFLTSATLTIPWTYEGVHSPEAVAGVIESRDNSVTDEEKEKRRLEAEEDSINFANMVVSLAEFIASVPESTKVIKICISCSDRLQRDVTASTIKAIVCQPLGTTTTERLKVLPWLSEESQLDAQQGHDNSDSSALKLQLKTLEEENYSLKRERNELLNQIMVEREAALHKDVLKPTVSSQDHISAPESDQSFERLNGSENANASNDTRTLTAKIIDLENKLNVANKRDADGAKFRADLEARNSHILQENEKLQKTIEDLNIQLTLTKHERDMSETRVNKSKEKIETLEAKVQAAQKELSLIDSLKAVQEAKGNEIASLVAQLDEKSKQITIILEEKQDYLDALNEAKSSNKRLITEFQQQIEELTNKLAKAEEDQTLYIRQIAVLSDLNTKQTKDLENLPKIKASLKEAETEVNRLQGEINHMAHKSESQSRDLKKSLKESAVLLSEYERALARKVGECNELSEKVAEYEANFLAANKQASSWGLSLPQAPIINVEPIRTLIASAANAGSQLSASMHSESSANEDRDIKPVEKDDRTLSRKNSGSSEPELRTPSSSDALAARARALGNAGASPNNLLAPKRRSSVNAEISRRELTTPSESEGGNSSITKSNSHGMNLGDLYEKAAWEKNRSEKTSSTHTPEPASPKAID